MNGTPHDSTVHDRIELAYPAALVDVREAVRISLGAARWWRVLRGVAYGTSVLAFLIAALELLLPGEPDAGTVAEMAGLGAGLVVLVRLMPWAVARTFLRAARAQGGDARAVVDAEGGRWTSRDTDTVIRWAMLPRYVETDRLFVLLTPRRAGTGFAYLPKHGLADAADADRLRALLDRHSSRV
ncbi:MULTISPECIES: YcxB family protein [unclassified Streptomyces]|uniref:YcxB family protein n=1 Tax=unclassified Streptomyces TaxID=2593676 RepID=UPI0004CAE583|nr:YcxB family protein [Streptomyces sp. NRRL F-5727]